MRIALLPVPDFARVWPCVGVRILLQLAARGVPVISREGLLEIRILEQLLTKGQSQGQCDEDGH